MSRTKLTAIGLAVCLSLAVAGATTATAAGPARTTIKSVTSFKFKPNRYIQDGLRWAKDTYKVSSGGTLHVVNGEGSEGPHTFTVLAKKDMPTTVRTLFSCRACAKLTRAHGADPNSEAPPRFDFLENGVGQATPPSIDRPGDSGLIGPRGRKGEFLDLTVTARAGTSLSFICLIHPWMQAKVEVQ